MRAMTDLVVTSLSGASARQAVFEQTPSSAWLYMTGPNGEPPIADCFLYNTGEGQQPDDEGPPPLDAQFASDYRVALPLAEDDIELIWSMDGNAVAARIRGEIVGFISPDDLQGYSRSVREDCTWAHRFDVEIFKRLFHPGKGE
jgi:hypothetical protein